MNKFFLQLVTANSGVSSKRFISLVGTLLLIAIIVLSFCGINVPDIAYYTVSGIILGASGMTLLQNKNTTENVDLNQPVVGFRKPSKINTPNNKAV
jgi:membrane-bound ClpP family serine protease